MKFSIDKKILQNNLGFVNRAIDSKTPIPALNGIKFDLTEDGLILVGSSLETSIKAFIPKTVNDREIINSNSTGTIILNHNFITEIVKKVDEDIINFELIDGANIKVSTATSVFNLNSISPEEYPKIDIIKSENKVVFKKSDLTTIVNQTVFSVSRNESRPILTGVNFNCVGNIINISATDSYRLSNKIITHDSDLNANLIIPGKSLADLNSICNGVGDITMYVFSNKVMFEFDNVVFQTKLLEGSYPNTQKLIPEEFSTELSISGKSLVNTIDRASILSRDKTKNIVKLTLEDGVAVISSNSPEVGKVEEKVDCNFIKPGSFSISFSARFVREAINALNSETVILKFNGDMKPFLIVNPEDNTVIQLVLPVRTY